MTGNFLFGVFVSVVAIAVMVSLISTIIMETERDRIQSMWAYQRQLREMALTQQPLAEPPPPPSPPSPPKLAELVACQEDGDIERIKKWL